MPEAPRGPLPARVGYVDLSPGRPDRPSGKTASPRAFRLAGADTVLTTREDVMTGLRFGIVSESVRPGRAWLDYARQLEDAGIGVLLIRDHFSAGAVCPQQGAFSPPGPPAPGGTPPPRGAPVLSDDFPPPAPR